MDARQADLLYTVDPAELGRRIGAFRRSRGLTQSQLAEGSVSVGYVSRIEAGQRRPTVAVLEAFAERLGVDVAELLSGVSASERDEIRLLLDYAELALDSGSTAEAEKRATAALERAGQPALAGMHAQARHLLALVAERNGHLDDAILELEALTADLAADGEDTLLELRTTIALSRCYRESGDLARAVDVGERLLTRLADGPLQASDEALQLSVTVAAAHFVRGDTGIATRICRRALERAEQWGSSRARGAAYWNASIIEAERGAVADAVELAERALGLLRAQEGNRNFARLQAELGSMQLQLDPPEVGEACRNLDRAAELYAWSNASPADLARNELARARAHLLSEDVEAALAIAAGVREEHASDLPMVSAEAYTIEGQAMLALGNADAALDAYRRAVALLTGIGADKSAANLWYEVADMLEELGDLDGARAAYRSAAAAAGVRRQAPSRALT